MAKKDIFSQFLELKTAIKQIAENHPNLQSEIHALLDDFADSNDSKDTGKPAPYEGMYAYAVDGSELYEGNFSSPGEAIDAAISFIDREWRDGDKIKFMIGMRAHPLDVTYGAKDPVRGLGNIIAETMGEFCGDAIHNGSEDYPEYPMSLNKDKNEELGQMVVGFMRQNAEVHDYGILHEIGFTHISSLGEADPKVFNEKLQSMKYEYVARTSGWLEDRGQIFRGIDGVTDLDKQNTEYANDWQEAVEIYVERATVGVIDENDSSQRMF